VFEALAIMGDSIVLAIAVGVGTALALHIGVTMSEGFDGREVRAITAFRAVEIASASGILTGTAK